MSSVGKLASLHRYPVKSLMGESINAAFFDAARALRRPVVRIG